MCIKALILLPALFAALTSSAFINPSDVDYGYWIANVTVNSTSPEARVCVVAAEYSANPGVINKWAWLHHSWLGTYGYLYPRPLIMWQTVTLNGAKYGIEGEAVVTMTCGEPPERLCTGSVLVDATLRVPDGPAAGHIPATTISLGFSRKTNAPKPT
ncbi:hypothetical protein F5B21DRAFT_499227 [Xylaria acuta]|nr:hypothetical protein F5B21DRAFT_499227 [Xylaria acuta]